jgi:hypothetical protein
VVSDYTPTLGEAEGRYSAGRLLLDGERDAGTATERYDEFYRMIAAIEREAAARALAEVRSTIGAYQENGVWAFDQAVACIEHARAAEIRGQHGND